MGKSPWFPFYPSDFLASNKVAVMTTEEIGAYFLLLCCEWADAQCALPNEDRKLQKLARFSGDLTNVKACFVEKDGALINERLYAEWKKSKKIRRLKSKAGVIGMRNRWDNTGITPAITEPITKHNQSQSHSQSQLQSPSELSSQSSSSSESEKKKICRERKILATSKSGPTYDAYAEEYRKLYGIAPVRNGKTNKILCDLVDQLGAEEAPMVAAFYVHHPNQWYVQKMHPVNLLLADASKLRTECFTGRLMTNGTARQVDQTATRGQVFTELLQEERAKHERSTR